MLADYMLDLTPSTIAGTPQLLTQLAQSKVRRSLAAVDEMEEKLMKEIVRSPTDSPPPAERNNTSKAGNGDNGDRDAGINTDADVNASGEDIDIDPSPVAQGVDPGTPPRSVDLKRKRSTRFDEPVTPANKKKKTIPKTPYEPFDGSSSEDEDGYGDEDGSMVEDQADREGNAKREDEELESDGNEFMLATQAPGMDLDVESDMDGDEEGDRHDDGEKDQEEGEDGDGDGDGDESGSVVVGEIDEMTSDDEEQVATQLEGDPLQIEDVTTPSPGRSP
jgi:hypothetical protein